MVAIVDIIEIILSSRILGKERYVSIAFLLEVPD